jgi:hypothetical protein
VTNDRQASVLRAVLELEHHVSAAGWDGPLRLFALIRTAGALAADPDLANRLPDDVVAAAHVDPEHLTAVEQDELPAIEDLEGLLHTIAWPASVDGAAVVVERLVLPTEAEATMPQDAEAAKAWVAAHPQRQELRLAAAVLRDGTNGCAVRSRGLDVDSQVATGPDLVPGLVEALATTLRD